MTIRENNQLFFIFFLPEWSPSITFRHIVGRCHAINMRLLRCFSGC